jgi:glucosyl-dolichyl phosphate glucuronosyltransferase
MLVTVAICTWNRSKLLDQTLTRMRELRIPEGLTWELLIVNNNCTDDTDQVISRHSGTLPIKRLFEPKQGHSNARNSAMREARGDLLIWTDDDVLVDLDWLANYVGAAERWPEVTYFGGQISPWYESDPPPWVLADFKLFEGILVIRNLGESERLMCNVEQPYGANMAFRRDKISRMQYDPDLGRRGNEAIVGDETDFINRLSRDGHLGVWVPSAKVLHHVPTGRLEYAYISHYFYCHGRTSVRMGERFEGATLGGVPRWLLRRYLELRLKACINWMRAKQDWKLDYLKAMRIHGIIDEMRSRPVANGSAN